MDGKFGLFHVFTDYLFYLFIIYLLDGGQNISLSLRPPA